MQTRLPSLELGLERGAKAGNCDSGYSCAYTSNLSWRSPESPVAKEVDPAAAFDRLFGDALADASLQQRSRRDRYKTSLLDLVREDAQDLQGKLGNSDRQKLEEYLYAVRDIERRLENASRLRNADAGLPDYPRPAGVPPEYEQHARLMFDLMTLAIQTDATRVLTFMFNNEGSNRSYPQIGVSDGHHDLSHHGNDREKQAKISKINHHHVSMFAYLIEKLANTPEADGTLLDNCMVLYGSGIGDGNAHNHDHLPLVLLGRGGGTLASGRHLSYADETPLTNLYLSMLQRVALRFPRSATARARYRIWERWPLRIAKEITDVFSIPSPFPLPTGARGHRTVISFAILSSNAGPPVPAGSSHSDRWPGHERSPGVRLSSALPPGPRVRDGRVQSAGGDPCRTDSYCPTD